MAERVSWLQERGGGFDVAHEGRTTSTVLQEGSRPSRSRRARCRRRRSMPIEGSGASS